MTRFSAITLCFLLGSCAASDESKPETPKVVAPEEVAEEPAASPASKMAAPSIASVRLVQDCPDKELASVTAPAPELAKAEKSNRAAKSKRKADSAGGFMQPCTQSTVQLAFTGQGSASATVALKEVRLASADGKALGTLSPRKPTIWKEGGYDAWDGALPAEVDSKVSYKLSLPDWQAVEAAIGGTSFGPMYILEIDVDVGGTVTTIRSPEFERGRAEIVKT
jgi:hypothetical protein